MVAKVQKVKATNGILNELHTNRINASSIRNPTTQRKARHEKENFNPIDNLTTAFISHHLLPITPTLLSLNRSKMVKTINDS